MPPDGAIRGRPIGTGGYIRRPSLRVASRTGNRARASSVISSMLRNAPLNSSVSLVRYFGLFIKRNIVPERAVAVVSVPGQLSA